MSIIRNYVTLIDVFEVAICDHLVFALYHEAHACPELTEREGTRSFNRNGLSSLRGCSFLRGESQTVFIGVHSWFFEILLDEQ